MTGLEDIGRYIAKVPISEIIFEQLLFLEPCAELGRCIKFDGKCMEVGQSGLNSYYGLSKTSATL